MKTMKRLGCLLLVLAMVLALGVSAMADTSSDASNFTIIVSGAADGETYSAFKIFDVTYSYDSADDDYNYSYTIDSDSPWFSIVQAATNVFTLTQVSGSTTYIVSVDINATDEEIIAVFTEASVPEGAEAAASVTASSSQAVLNVTNSGAGYYFVTTTLGSLVIIDTTNPTQTISEKNGIPTIEKYVHKGDVDESKEDDEDNHTNVTFQLEIGNINGAVNLVVHDAMGEGLEIPETGLNVSVTLYADADDTEGAVLTENVDYTVAIIGEDNAACSRESAAINETDETDGSYSYGRGCSFEINFTEYDFTDVSSEAYIVITYDLLLNEEGNAFENDYDEIDNWAQLTFGNVSESAVVEAEVYSFGFEVEKYTPNLNDTYVTVGQLPGTVGQGTATYYVCYCAEGWSNGSPVSENIYYGVITSGKGTEDEPYIVTGWTNSIETATGVTLNGEETDHYFAGLVGTQSQGCMLYYVTSGSGAVAGPSGYVELSQTNVEEEAYTPLAGVEFQLSNDSGQVAYFETETVGEGNESHTVYLFEGWADSEKDVPDDMIATLVTAADGMLYIEGLDVGTYTLTETKALDGYNPLAGSISVSITASYNEETGAITDHAVSYTYGDVTVSQEGSYVVYVENNTGTILPGTGGIGTTIFYVVGAILVCGAVVLLVTKRRTSNKNEAEA